VVYKDDDIDEDLEIPPLEYITHDEVTVDPNDNGGASEPSVHTSQNSLGNDIV